VLPASQEIGGGLLLSKINGKVVGFSFSPLVCSFVFCFTSASSLRAPAALDIAGFFYNGYDAQVIECTWDAEWTTLTPDENGKTWEDRATFRQARATRRAHLCNVVRAFFSAYSLPCMQGGWRFSRFRPDRELPNDVSVFMRVNDALKEVLSLATVRRTLVRYILRCISRCVSKGLGEEELLAKIAEFSAGSEPAAKRPRM
jgi:hypothetical protein